MKVINMLQRGGCLLSVIFSLLLFSPELNACDTSGFIIDNVTDNCDGTYTIEMTILVGGFPTTSVGSTWGFYWNIDAPILNVLPGSLTSQNGTTINAVITGMTVTWGDPAPSASTPFVDIDANEPSQNFQVTIVVGGFPTSWSGGGQEANMCPGGPGTNPNNFEGEICLEPELTAPIQEVEICPGEIANLSVLANCSTTSITWEPGGLVGPMVSVSPLFTTTYTITGSNPCAETSTTITVVIKPLPEIEPVEEEIDACPGLPVVMEVSTQFTNFVTWEPGGFVGNFLVTIPPSLPITYTATAQNECDEATTTITINPLPYPEVDIVNGNESICLGDTITLEAEAMFEDQVLWGPGNETTYEIEVSPDTTTEYLVFAFNECGVDTATVVVSVFENVTDTVFLEACDGQTVLYNGLPLNAGSTSTFTFPSQADCDSLVTVIVEELPAFMESVELAACEGETVSYNGQNLQPGTTTEFTFTATSGCDSIVTVTVEELQETSETVTLGACTGTTVNFNGQNLNPNSSTQFTLTGSNGCDSVLTVNVLELQVYDQTLMFSTCTGTTVAYNGQQLQPGSTTVFNFTTFQGCDSTVTVEVEELAQFNTAVELNACTGTTATYNGQQLAPGTVTDFTFTTANGCDSIVTVTVNEVTAITETVELTACTGSTATYNGQMLMPGTTTDFTFTTAQGCDSIVTVNVAELPVYDEMLELQACTGTTVTYDGQELQPGTTTDFTFPTYQGCDSIVRVTVEEIQSVTESLTLQACEGETVPFGGQQLAPGTSTDFTYTSYLGCDSILTVTVDELPNFSTPVQLQACTGSTVTFNGVNIPAGTVIDFTLTSVDGCDSVLTVTVEEVEEIEEELELEACAGSTVLYNGQMLMPGTSTDFTFTSYLGCDSIVTVEVVELAVIEDVLLLEACAGESVLFDGQMLAAGSVTDFNYTTAQGCDSILTVTVDELDTFTGVEMLQACTGSTVTYNGQPLAPGTVTDFTLTAQNGCDSVVTVTVEEVAVITESLTLEACEGESVLFDGQMLAAGSVTDFNYTTAQGCDSILTVTVDELAIPTSSLTLEACEGSSVPYAGQSLLAGSTTDVTLTGPNGCDSIVTVSVDVLPSSTGAVTLQDCSGVPLIYDGVEVEPGTSTDFVFTAANGCDSVVTVTALEPLNGTATTEEIEICEGDFAIIFGQPVASPGDYSETFISSNGCDSVHTVTLTVSTDALLLFSGDITIQFGDSVVLDPIVNPNATLTYQWAADPTLSCSDCKNPVARPLVDTEYTLTVIDANGCFSTASVRVIVDKNLGVYIPNSFSPNGDGINDVFMIFSDGRSVEQIKSFQVFSRWGETVHTVFNFPPDDNAYGWDGFYRGDLMDPGVFVWFAEVRFIDGTERLFKGDVTLVK